MAIGLNPKYIELLPINSATPQQFLALATEISASLNWVIAHIDEKQLIAHTNNGPYVHNAEITITIDDGTAYLKSASAGNEMVDMGKNRKNIAAFIACYYDLRKSFTTEELLEKYELALQHLAESKITAEGNDKDAEIAQTVHMSDFASFFKPSKTYFITPIIIYLNIAIFIMMVCFGVHFMEPTVESLILWGGNIRELTTGGEWWRLLSCIFLHAGVVHLVFNMFALAYIGMLLEPRLGRFKFAFTYLIVGIAASATSIWHSGYIVSVGASGAIFGMYGVFLALLTTNYIDKAIRKALFSSIAVFIVYNLIGGMKGSIDNAAHIGGLMCGFLMGYLLIPSLRKPNAVVLKFATVAIMAVFVLGITIIFSKTTTDDTQIYEGKMAEFLEMEPLALEVYGHLQYGGKADILNELKNRSTYYWNENLKLVNEIEELSLPSEIHDQNKVIKEYCEERIRFNKILYNAINEETTQYEAQLQEVNRRIEALRARIN